MSTPVGPEPTIVTCPNCHKQVTTSIDYITSTKTHLLAILLCVLGCCCCAPCLYCTKCARNVEHRCPSCDAFVGMYER